RLKDGRRMVTVAGRRCTAERRHIAGFEAAIWAGKYTVVRCGFVN
ncbi:hypothetical protein A2U01_0045207, partial [Trifolium medium]|nr:hypothetical protein [Trifolium medium]